jgi:hypothetical protein
LSLPRGCLDEVVAILEEQLIVIEFDDKRKTGQKIKKIHFKGELRNDQKKAVTKLNQFDTGILHQPIMFMQAGSIRHTVKADAREQFEQQVVVTELDTIPPS